MLRQERPHRSCIGGERALSAKRSPPEFVAAALPPKIAARKAQCFRAVSASAVLSALFRGSAIQRHSASALPRRQRLSGTQRALPRLSASAFQCFRASVLPRFSASELPSFRVLRDSALPRLLGPQWWRRERLSASAPSAPQRYSARSSAAQCFSATALPCFRASAIQRPPRLRDSAPQRHSAVCVTASCIRRRRFYSSVPPIHSATDREPRR